MAYPIISSYKLELPEERKRVFVTQLREDEEEDDYELNIRKIPIVKEKAGKLVEMGYKTLQKTLLLKREAEVNVIDIEFIAKQKEYKERIEKCKQNQKDIQRKQKALEDRMEKFRKFIEENNAKKQRAVIKCQQEIKIRERKNEEYENLYEELQDLIMKTENLKEKLRKYKIFEEYLFKVIDVTPEGYLEATDNMVTALMMRYETLETVHTNLLNNRNDLQNQLQSYSNILQGLSLEQSQDLLICNKEVAVSQERLEKLYQQNTEREITNAQIKQKFINDYEMKGQILLGIENLSEICETRRNLNNMSLFEKLDMISHYVIERQMIYEMSRPTSPDKSLDKTYQNKPQGMKIHKTVRIKVSSATSR